MKTLIIANCHFPTGITINELENLFNKVRSFEKLIILGDFLDLGKEIDNIFILEIGKSIPKLLSKILKHGCSEITYVIGDLDKQLLIDRRLISKIFSSKKHVVNVVDKHFEKLNNNVLVFTHGHIQLNIAIPDAYMEIQGDEKVLVRAARYARKKEESVGLRKLISGNRWWFIAHTSLLEIDQEFKIVHVGHLTSKVKISGCGIFSKLLSISQDEHRGFIMIEDNTIKLIKYPSFKVKKEIVI